MKRQKMPLPRKLAIAGVVVVFLGSGAIKLRNVADGWRNALSLQYWLDRRSGRDLYNKDEQYLKRGNRSFHDVLLTFDDAPRPSSDARILDILKSENVPATFFVIGKRVKERPDLVKRMIDQGDEVGNHTEDHLRLDTLSAKKVHDELAQCEMNVENATGHRMSLIRPPGMRLSAAVRAETKAMDYTIVGWNIGAKDFVPDQKVTDMSMEETIGMHTTPDQVTERVLRQVKDGVIILLHDNPITADALPAIIQGLKKRGFTFATTAEFLSQLPNPVQVVSNPMISPKLAAVHRPLRVR